MAKAQRDWAEALAARQPLPADEVAAFVDSVAASAAAANGAGGGAATAAASLEAVVPLALFLSRSLGKVRCCGVNAAAVLFARHSVALPCSRRMSSTILPLFVACRSSRKAWCPASWQRCEQWWMQPRRQPQT